MEKGLPSPLKLPPSPKSSFFWSVEGNGGALGVAVPSVSGRRGQGLIGAAVSGQQTLLSARRGKKAEGRSPGEGDGGRCISVSGEKSRTAASLLGPDSWILGSEAGRIFEGLYHGQAFFLPDGMPPLKGETMERCHALMQWRPAPFVLVER